MILGWSCGLFKLTVRCLQTIVASTKITTEAATSASRRGVAGSSRNSCMGCQLGYKDRSYYAAKLTRSSNYSIVSVQRSVNASRSCFMMVDLVKVVSDDRSSRQQLQQH